MGTARPRRTLIVANRTAATHLLAQEVELRAAQRPTEFVLLIPTVSSRKATDWTLDEALSILRRAAGGPNRRGSARVDGLISASNAFESIRQALAEGSYDDVIISTLPRRRSGFLRRDLAGRVERLGVPVRVIAPLKDDPRSLFERFAQDVPPIGTG